MANPQEVIANAFAKFKLSISEEDAHNFASTELKDVWLALREIDKKQRMRQSAQNLRRIEPLLRGLEKYRKVIEVLCNGTPYMPYIWAPIKVMLEIASHHRNVFEALLSAYADIGAALPRFDRYKTAFNDNLEFQYALAAVYTGILDFHQRAYKFLRRRAWHVIFLSLWKDFNGRFDCIIDSLKKQRDFIDVEAASFDIVEAKESRKRVQDEIRRTQKQELEIIKQNEENLRVSQIQHCISWLPSDETMQEIEYDRASKRRHDGTCEWLANEPQFKSWLKDDAKLPCLWIDGKPGSGKSVMCSYVVQTLTTKPGLTVCYYFCRSQDSRSVSHQILTFIVRQIVKQNPDTYALIANEFVYPGIPCGMAQLRILVPLLLDVIAYTRIVVDGIDECSKQNQKEILKELQIMCTRPNTHCKILFSSRKEVDIYKRLSGHPRISMDGRQEVDKDIRSFVKHKIKKLNTYDRDLLDRIESILAEKANGMFLWVRLVVKELKYCHNDAHLEETAKSLPKGLKAAYGRILDRIMDFNNSRNRGYMALRILGWMACSYRVLKIYELLDGISFDASNTTLTPKTKIQKQILDVCRPLIEEGPASTVDFVHFSAKEYILEEEYQAGRPFICRESAHLDLSFSCVTFLNSCFCLISENSTEAQRAAVIIRGHHGLQPYADKFWYKHLLDYCCGPSGQQRPITTELEAQLQLLLRFRKEDSRIPMPVSQTVLEKAAPEASRLEVLTHLGDVKRLVSDVLKFQAKISRAVPSDKSPTRISLESCETDPTYFSTVRHHYHQTVESLVGDRASATFPEISQSDLQVFRDIYGTSAFVCRYGHCVSSYNSFECSSQRANHESKHQRLFRCSFSSCAYFTRGFATRNKLNNHNERYHSVSMTGPSLHEVLHVPPPRNFLYSPPKFQAPQNQQQITSNPSQSQPNQPNLASPFEGQPAQAQTQAQQNSEQAHDNIDFDAMVAADASGSHDLNAADGDYDFSNDILLHVPPPRNFIYSKPQFQALQNPTKPSQSQPNQPNLASPFDFDAMFAADASGSHDLNAADKDINFDDFFNDIVGDAAAQGSAVDNANTNNQISGMEGVLRYSDQQ